MWKRGWKGGDKPNETPGLKLEELWLLTGAEGDMPSHFAGKISIFRRRPKKRNQTDVGFRFFLRKDQTALVSAAGWLFGDEEKKRNPKIKTSQAKSR